MTRNQKTSKIELRSEKVRNIVGKTPSILLRKGMIIISLVILMLFVFVYNMPYTEELTFELKLSSIPQIQQVNSSLSGFAYVDSCLISVKKNQRIGFVIATTDSILEIRSNIEGGIIYNFSNCSKVEKDETLFVIVPNIINQVFFEGYVPYNKISNIRLKQEIDIQSLNASKNIHITGFVSKIYSIPNNNHYKIQISIPNPIAKEYLMLDYRATIFSSEGSIFEKIFFY